MELRSAFIEGLRDDSRTILNPSSDIKVMKSAKIGKALAALKDILVSEPGTRAAQLFRQRCPAGGAFDPSTRGCINSDSDGRKKALWAMARQWDTARSVNTGEDDSASVNARMNNARSNARDNARSNARDNARSNARDKELSNLMERLTLERRELDKLKAEVGRKKADQNAKNAEHARRNAELAKKKANLNAKNREHARIAGEIARAADALKVQKKKLARKEAAVEKLAKRNRAAGRVDELRAQEIVDETMIARAEVELYKQHIERLKMDLEQAKRTQLAMAAADDERFEANARGLANEQRAAAVAQRARALLANQQRAENDAGRRRKRLRVD